MSLTLRVSEASGEASALPESGAPGSLTLERGKATVGRGPHNDLVLPDPQRVISKQHCIIECIDGRYRVTDTSTNGVFLNHGEEPIGKGKHAYLEDGDLLRISHYELLAQVERAARPVSAGQGSETRSRSILSETLDRPERRETLDRMIGLSDGPSGGPSGVPSATGAPEPHGRQIIPEDSGIWAPPRASQSSQSSAPQSSAPQSSGQHISPEREFFQAPAATEAIPEDWESTPQVSAEAAQPLPPEQPAAPDLPPEGPPERPPDRPQNQPADLFAGPIEPQQAAPEAADPTPEAPQPSAASSEPRPARSGGAQAAEEDAIAGRAFLDAFLDGAELEDLRLTDEQAEELMYLMGQIYREVVTGLMELLAARSSIKNEFRLSQTTIQPAQNNPLKFSLGADDAMAALLTRRGRTYLPPVEAIREAVGDVKAHQVAVLAGMQLALGGLLRRFDPAALEERMRNDRSLAGIMGAKKARYWDTFKQMYQDLIVEAEDDFHNLFGKEFNRAYEEQVRKLDKR